MQEEKPPRRGGSRLLPSRYYVTLKMGVLVALPPFVVTTILPVVAPVGTSALTSVSEITVKVADFPSNVTFVVCFRPVPLMVTEVPTGPLVGLKLVMVGSKSNVFVLVNVVVPVVTVKAPVSAPAGTVAVINVVPDSTTVVAFVPPNLTTEELLKPCPRMPIFAPSLPEVDCISTNGPRPTDRLKTVPSPSVPPFCVVP